MQHSAQSKQEEKEIGEVVHSNLCGDMNLDPPEWQPSVLNITPSNIHQLHLTYSEKPHFT